MGLPGEFKITLESAKEGDHLDVVAGRDFSKVRLPSTYVLLRTTLRSLDYREPASGTALYGTD